MTAVGSVGLGAMSAFAAALTFGANPERSVEDVLTVVENGALDSPLFSAKGAAIADGGFEPRFPVGYQFKALALVASGDIGVPMVATAAAQALFSAARGRGHGDEDIVAAIERLEETTGVEVRNDGSP